MLPVLRGLLLAGLVATAWGHVYVTHGIGQTAPPVRLLARPEVAVIRLRVG